MSFKGSLEKDLAELTDAVYDDVVKFQEQQQKLFLSMTTLHLFFCVTAMSHKRQGRTDKMEKSVMKMEFPADIKF